MKNLLSFFVLSILFSASSFAQSQNEYFNIMYPIEQKLQNIASMNLGSLSLTKLDTAFRNGGVLLSDKGLQQMKDGLSVLEGMLGSSSARSTLDVNTVRAKFAATGINLTLSQAQNIYNHINGGRGVVLEGQNAHVYLMALIAKNSDARFAKFLDEIVKEANRPSKPDSPSRRSIGRVVDRTLSLQKMNLPKTSGAGDWIENAYTSLGYSYVDFRDDSTNGDGNEKIIDLTIGGDIGGNNSLSFSLSHQNSRRGGDSPLKYESNGVDVVFHHKFNETFGAGIYGFYQETDIDAVEDNIFGAGGGFLVSAYHDFGIFEISTVHTISKVYYKYGHDQLYVGAVTLNRNWNDSFGTFLTASYTDSLKHDQIGDNSYWTAGGGVNWFMTDNITLSLEYEKVLALDDYRSHTFRLNFRWNF